LTNAQAEHYERDYDYQSESPHLKHRQLYETLTGKAAEAIRKAAPSGHAPEVLEIGAGDGAVTERLLSLGFSVTGTEMSPDSVDEMNTRFGDNDRFQAFHDPDGDLTVLGERRFDTILFASVLHHIPDYLGSITSAIDSHLSPGGSFISVQDPLWYPRLTKPTHLFTKFSYLTWRVAQGEIGRGIKTRTRRLFKGLSEEAPGDAVEYHVVREGVDEEAIARLLEKHFRSVQILPYWSSQGTPQQKLGTRLGMKNTFAVFATGYAGVADTAAA